MYKCKHFEIYELVSKKVYKKYGETAWQFFDEKLLRTIDLIRDLFDAAITINDWQWGGNFQQRGLRSNIDNIVKDHTNNNLLYCSAHCYGQAVDFDIEGYTAEEVRQYLKENKEFLPYPIRLENNVSWVHLDIRDTGSKVYIFNA